MKTTIFLILILLVGCHAPQKVDTATMTDAAKVKAIGTIEKVSRVYDQGLLVASLVALCVVGVIVCFQRITLGLSMLVGGGLGLLILPTYQAYAVHSWLPLVMASVVALAGIALVGWYTFRDKIVQREIVDSVQYAKKVNPDIKEKLNTALGAYQSDETKKAVAKIKEIKK